MKTKNIIEGLLFASSRPLSVRELRKLLRDERRYMSAAEVKSALSELERDYAGRGVILKEVASGFRFQTQVELSSWMERLWEEKPQRYTKALLETLSLIAYCQPITRGEIEVARGVSLNVKTLRTLEERGWVVEVGRKESPGRPAMYGTTQEFLDYFNLRSLDELPALLEVERLKDLYPDLRGVSLDEADANSKAAPDAAPDASPDEATPKEEPKPAAELKDAHSDKIADVPS